MPVITMSDCAVVLEKLFSEFSHTIAFYVGHRPGQVLSTMLHLSSYLKAGLANYRVQQTYEFTITYIPTKGR